MTYPNELLTPPRVGDGEQAWIDYATALAARLQVAEIARAASRKAANRRSSVLNAIQRDLDAGDVAAARARLDRRDQFRQEARR